MEVGSVQDVMLAAVAVGGMQGAQGGTRGINAPRGAAQLPQQTASMTDAADAEYAAQQERAQEESARAPMNEEQTSYITEQLNEIMRNINVDLQFQYHKEVNFMSVQMLDKKTGEVLREVPPEAMVEHMIKVHDWIGAFLDKTA